MLIQYLCWNIQGNVRLRLATIRKAVLIFVSYLAIKVILRCWFTKHINEATIFKLNHSTLQKILIEFYAGESTANNITAGHV